MAMRGQGDPRSIPGDEQMPVAPSRRPHKDRGVRVIGTPAAVPMVSIRDELARLGSLDPEGLKLRWRAIMGKHAPTRLPRFLMVGVLARRLQEDVTGGLDRNTVALLDRLAIANAGGEGDGGALASLSSLGLYDPRAGRLQPGSVLVREHGGVVHHVMVLVDGFAWNGQTYSSLSKVALAITGTTWNGRRFFGIDARTPRGTESRAPGKSKGTAATGNAP